jgi:hypothetical protein
MHEDEYTIIEDITARGRDHGQEPVLLNSAYKM